MLLGASTLLLSLPFSSVQSAFIEPVSVAEKLLYSTTRVVGKNKKGESIGGTGFFYRVPTSKDTHTTLLITNNHVIRDLAGGADVWVHTRAAPSGKPDAVMKIHIDGVLGNDWISHPSDDVDLCAFPIQPQLDSEKMSPLVAYLSNKLVPSQTALDELDAIEEIIMVGYPEMLYDQKNEYPILRRGITASHPAVDFNGKDETAIDIPIFHGSSGSPVLIYNPGGTHVTKGDGTVVGGTRVIFLGIVYGGAIINPHGEIKIIEAPTTILETPKAITAQITLETAINVGRVLTCDRFLALLAICTIDIAQIFLPRSIAS